MRVPIALHSTQSAMSLLHTIPPAYLITETGPARYVDFKSSWMALLDEFQDAAYGHAESKPKILTRNW